MEDSLLEEVTKKEPQESPTLLISDVQTVKTEDGPNSPGNPFLKVRTPTSINNGSPTMGQQSGKVLVKRLGSTTIRSVPAVNMKHAAKAQLVKMANGSYQTHPAFNTSPRIPMMSPQAQAPLPKPVTPLYRAPPDPRDDIIRQLQEQNREMKKMLLECRREASQIHTKMRRWTVAINEVLGRVQTLQPPGTMKAVPTKPTMIPPPHPQQFPPQFPPQNPQQQFPPQFPPQLPPPLQAPRNGPTMKVTARKSTSLPPPPATHSEIVFRSPAFPIKSFSSLNSFESDLKNREFFEFVGLKLMTTISKFKIEKPATLLAYVLQTLVNPSLLLSMVWDSQDQVPHESGKRLALVNFRRLRELYSRLVNNMSRNLYGKNLDPAAVERFLRSKLFSEQKFRQQNAMVQMQQMANRQVELRKALENEPKSSQEDDGDDVEWVDNKVAENSDLGNEILGDVNEPTTTNDENEQQEMEDQEDAENGDHPVSTVEENEFHFMDGN